MVPLLVRPITHEKRLCSVSGRLAHARELTPSRGVHREVLDAWHIAAHRFGVRDGEHGQVGRELLLQLEVYIVALVAIGRGEAL